MEKDTNKKMTSFMAIGSALGAGIGTAIGAATDNFGLWIAVGMGCGIAIGVMYGSNKENKK